MNSYLISLIDLLEDILEHNQVILTKSVSPGVYEKHIYPHREKIICSSIVPIEDLLRLEEVQWHQVQLHPDLTIQIVEKHFENFNFLDLIENLRINFEFLCQMLEERNPRSPFWENIKNSSRLTSKIILKYKKHFDLAEIDQLIHFEMSIREKKELLEYHYAKNPIDLELLIKFKLPFEVFYNIISKPTITIDDFFGLPDDDQREIIDLYFEVYSPSVNLVKELELIYRLFCKKLNYFDRHIFEKQIVKNLLDRSYVAPNEFKYLIKHKIITKFPSIPIKYRRISALFYRKVRSKVIKLPTLIHKGKLTTREYKKLLKKKNRYPSKLLSIAHLKNVSSTLNDDKEKVKNFLIENKDCHHIIADLYNQCQKSLDFKEFWELITNHPSTVNSIFNILPEQFLYLWYLDKFAINKIFHGNSYIKSLDESYLSEFSSLLRSREFSPEFLRLILEDKDSLIYSTQEPMQTIALRQKLTPDLVNDFWDKFNPLFLHLNSVWKKYPANMFNHAPIMNLKNFWLWATPEEKYDYLKKLKSPYQITLWDEDPNWVVLSNIIKDKDNYNLNYMISARYNCYYSNIHDCTNSNSCKCGCCTHGYSVRSLIRSNKWYPEYRFRKKKVYGKNEQHLVSTYRFLLSDLNIFEDKTQLSIITETPAVLMED